MPEIKDKDGKVVQRSRNLRGIREFTGRWFSPPIKVLSIDHIGDGRGKLSILFENGFTYETYFADFSVLAEWVRRWRAYAGLLFASMAGIKG